MTPKLSARLVGQTRSRKQSRLSAWIDRKLTAHIVTYTVIYGANNGLVLVLAEDASGTVVANSADIARRQGLVHIEKHSD